MINYVK